MGKLETIVWFLYNNFQCSMHAVMLSRHSQKMAHNGQTRIAGALNKITIMMDFYMKIVRQKVTTVRHCMRKVKKFPLNGIFLIIDYIVKTQCF